MRLTQSTCALNSAHSFVEFFRTLSCKHQHHSHQNLLQDRVYRCHRGATLRGRLGGKLITSRAPPTRSGATRGLHHPDRVRAAAAQPRPLSRGRSAAAAQPGSDSARGPSGSPPIRASPAHHPPPLRDRRQCGAGPVNVRSCKN